jgi:DnaJ-domain-containing protein 1
MRELDPRRKLTLHKPEGNRRDGKPKFRWLESVEEGLKNMGVRNSRRKTKVREQWRKIMDEAQVHQRL